MSIKIRIQLVAIAIITVGLVGDLHARGFGGARGGGGFRGGHVGGAAQFRGGGYGGARMSNYGARVGTMPNSRNSAARRGTYVGPRGSTVRYGAAGGSGVGPRGGGYAGAAHGAQVTGPEGRSVARGGAHGVAAGPFGGVAAGGGWKTAFKGTDVSGEIGRRGGVAVGPQGGVAAGGSRGAAVNGPNGAAAVGERGGVAVGPRGGVAAGGSRGAAAVGVDGSAAWRHSTRYVNPGYLSRQGALVRNGYHYHYFTGDWYTAHPGAWYAAGWTANALWTVPLWPALSSWCGVVTAPIMYDYGSNVVIHDDSVYVDGAAVATTQEYANQATEIADAGRTNQPVSDAGDDWKPLGVFGLIQKDEKIAQRIFQLAVNQDGIVRGNYYDAVGDNTLPVYGSVDAKTQRVAWSIGDKKATVFEAGLNNLTKPQTTVLVHYGTDRTQQMILVRLKQSESDGAAKTAPTTDTRPEEAKE